MDKTKLAAFGERLKIGGERLKVGGAEMGRKFSGKMKEILQGQSQEAKMVEDATSEGLEEPNWGLNLRICNLINSEEFDGSEVVRTIKKKISGKSPIAQRLSLELLEACAMNCEKVFSEVASEKVLEEMVKMIDNPQTQYANEQKALQLIEAWGKSDDLSYLPVFKQTYLNLKSREIPNEQADGSSAQLFSSLEDDFEEHESLPRGYPLPSSGLQTTVVGSVPLQGVSISNEEKKELLTITRNSLEIISSLLSSETKEKPTKDELLISMVEKCKESQPDLQRIIETTTDDEAMLFEALNLHDELEQVLANYAKFELTHTPPIEQFHGVSDSSEQQKGTASGEKEEERKIVDVKDNEVVDESRKAEKKE
ncbi:TOM1-like protein 2 isoform X2 [Phalaenopsis equestris]|uniref:TOM1-like protein 2 isoform X2 n=1 Tax=Phalaenopsis equestris TaxID=78828 RepID=UPI0009E492C0|nr:TOM1-like protein 2 isoform X2 [Phalaenopsis equestris]